jgi:hypothetical protein
VICPSCDFANPEGFKFCGACAGPLDASGARPIPASPIERERRRKIHDSVSRAIAQRLAAERIG